MINVINHAIKIDLAKSINMINAIQIKKNDTASHKFIISILNNSLAYDLTGLTARIYFKKYDNTKVFLDCTIDDATNGILGVVLTTQSLSCAGIVGAEVTIYGTSGELLTSVTFNFYVNDVVRDDAAIISSNEYTALTNALTTYNALKSEVETARGGQASLGARLDGFDSSLADIVNLKSDIRGTTQNVTTNASGDITQVEHVNASSVVVRRDTFDYSTANLIVETRTWISTGATLVYKYHADTLATEVI